MADLMGTKMVSDGKTAREIFDAVMANPARKKFGFGEKLAIVNVDIQRAYTDLTSFKTSYETDPDQIAYVNRISALARAKGMPVIWSRVAYKADAGDAGIWGTRTDTEDSLQNIKYDSERHEFDPRCEIDADDMTYTKRMPSAFSNVGGSPASRAASFCSAASGAQRTLRMRSAWARASI